MQLKILDDADVINGYADDFLDGIANCNDKKKISCRHGENYKMEMGKLQKNYNRDCLRNSYPYKVYHESRVVLTLLSFGSKITTQKFCNYFVIFVILPQKYPQITKL